MLDWKETMGELGHIFMIVWPSALLKKKKKKQQEGKPGEPVSIFPNWKHLWVEFVSLFPLKYFSEYYYIITHCGVILFLR